MRRLVLLTLALSLCLTPLIAYPASAGDGYYSPSGCDGGRRAHEGQWWGVPGQGTWYKSAYGEWFVGSGFYYWFSRQNYECSALGFPASNAYNVPGGLYRPGDWVRQDFEGGSLHYINSRWVQCNIYWNCYYLS